MINSTLRLFNAIPISSTSTGDQFKSKTIERMIRNGYLIDTRISVDSYILNSVENIVGISGEKANASFHKSWKVVRDSSIEKLIIQQIVHYITTYLFEDLGIYDKDTVYIPIENLEIPEIKNIPLFFIKGLTKEEILEKIITVGSGIALSEEVLKDIMIIIKGNQYESGFVKEIKNKELLSRLYEYYDIVPQEPVEYLRYVIFKLTNQTLIIKNQFLINEIKNSNGNILDKLLKKAPKNLSSIFFRFKPLFLAMKSISSNKSFFNRLRKDANNSHLPLREDYFSSITSKIINGKIDSEIFKRRLNEINTYRKVRLANALMYRINSCIHKNDSIVYRVRNGKGYSSTFKNGYIDDFKYCYEIVFDSIVKDISEKLKDKTVYLPKNIVYTLPATEKQFTGNFPTGTYVSVEDNLIVGIHWFNTKNRIDLDLSLLKHSGKIGWDGSYRNNNRSIMFSGDVTDAPKPKGASELFYLESGLVENGILMVNNFTFNNDEVPFKLFVGQDNIKNLNRNYMIDPNKIIAQANINLTKVQSSIGLVTNVENENRIYFYNIAMSNSISSSYNENISIAKDYMFISAISSINFNDVLTKAGINIINEINDDLDEFIDLSPNSVTKETFIKIMN